MWLAFNGAVGSMAIVGDVRMCGDGLGLGGVGLIGVVGACCSGSGSESESVSYDVIGGGCVFRQLMPASTVDVVHSTQCWKGSCVEEI